MDNQHRSFFEAVEEGNLEKLRSLWNNEECRIDIDHRDENDRTAFYKAVRLNNYDMVQFFLQNKADVNVKDDTGSSPLHEALLYSNVPIVELILNHKIADWNPKTKIYYTAFRRILHTKNEQLIDLLVNYADEFTGSSVNNETALHIAITKCSSQIIKILVKKIADVDEKTFAKEETALHYLLRFHAPGQAVFEKLELLVAHGADVNAIDKDGRSPLYNAVIKLQGVRVLDYLVRKGANVDGSGCNVPLVGAIRRKDLDAIKVLLSHGASITFHDEYGRNVFQIVRDPFIDEKTRYYLFALLMRKSANPSEYCDDRVATIFADAIERRDLKLLNFFLERGAPVNGRDHDGYSPLYRAVDRPFYEAVEVLINSGANVHDRVNHSSALSLAIRDGSKKIAKLLLRAGAIPSEHDFLEIASTGSVKMITLMATANFKIDRIRNSMFVRALGRLDGADVVKYLIDDGADVNCKYDLDRLPLSCLLINRRCRSELNRVQINDTRNIHQLIKRIKLLAASGGFVDQQNFELINSTEETREYAKICDEELAGMRVTKICDGFYPTYFDVVARRGDALVSVLRCESVRAKLDLEDYDELFPEYSDCLKINYSRGAKRLVAVDACFSMLGEIFRGILPQEIIHRISEFTIES